MGPDVLVILSIASGNFQRCADIADVPAEIGIIIDRCMEMDPAKRYSNATELAEAIEAMA